MSDKNLLDTLRYLSSLHFLREKIKKSTKVLSYHNKKTIKTLFDLSKSRLLVEKSNFSIKISNKDRERFRKQIRAEQLAYAFLRQKPSTITESCKTCKGFNPKDVADECIEAITYSMFLFPIDLGQANITNSEFRNNIIKHVDLWLEPLKIIIKENNNIKYIKAQEREMWQEKEIEVFEKNINI